MLGVFGLTDTGIAASSKQEQYLREASEARFQDKNTYSNVIGTACVNHLKRGPRRRADAAVPPIHAPGVRTAVASTQNGTTPSRHFGQTVHLY